jgi:phosphohistidine phosphatase
MLDRRAEEIDAAMRLMLLRHAKAEKAGPGMRDHDRALQARGRNESTQMASYLVQHGLRPDRVIVSSARRTRETWEHMAPAFSPAPPVDYQERLYESSPQTLVSVIRDADRSAPALLLIGHNPGLHDTALLLLGRRGNKARRLEEGLPTAGLVVIDFADDDWRRLAAGSGRLVKFITPRLLEKAKE